MTSQGSSIADTERPVFARLNELAIPFTRHEHPPVATVSPFGLINDQTHAVCVVLDRDLEAAERVSFHPNINTATLMISGADFKRFLAARGNPVRYLAR